MPKSLFAGARLPPRNADPQKGTRLVEFVYGIGGGGQIELGEGAGIHQFLHACEAPLIGFLVLLGQDLLRKVQAEELGVVGAAADVDQGTAPGVVPYRGLPR